MVRRAVVELRRRAGPYLDKMRVVTGLKSLPLFKPPVIDPTSIVFTDLYKMPSGALSSTHTHTERETEREREQHTTCKHMHDFLPA